MYAMVSPMSSMVHGMAQFNGRIVFIGGSSPLHIPTMRHPGAMHKEKCFCKLCKLCKLDSTVPLVCGEGGQQAKAIGC